jgi:hypothetical protein
MLVNLFHPSLFDETSSMPSAFSGPAAADLGKYGLYSLQLMQTLLANNCRKISMNSRWSICCIKQKFYTKCCFRWAISVLFFTKNQNRVGIIHTTLSIEVASHRAMRIHAGRVASRHENQRRQAGREPAATAGGGILQHQRLAARPTARRRR